MTTATQPGPEPRFVNTADLEALEGRIINRLALLEARLEGKIDSKPGTWGIVALIAPLYLFVMGALLSTILFLLPHVKFA